MRNLHARNDPGGVPASGAVSASHRRSNSRGTGWKLVPLYRIPKDLRCGPRGRQGDGEHMRAYVPEYDLVAPESLAETLRIISREPGVWRPIAGGTDLMVLFEAGKLPFHKLLSLSRIAELRGFTASESYVTLGALTTYTDVLRSETMHREFPLQVKAA